MKNDDDKRKEVIKINIVKLTKNYCDKTDIIAFLSIIIYEKCIFKHNYEIKNFIKEIFNIVYLDYVISSRTMIFSRISKDIYSMDEETVQNIRIQLLNYFNKEKGQEKKLKHKKKKNENDKLETWLKRL